MTTATTARGARPEDLLRQAHDGVYRWPAGARRRFDVVACRDGDEVAGVAEVAADGTIDIEIRGEGELARWASAEARMILDHRRANRFEDADGRHELTVDGDANEDGLLIRVGDSLQSTYHLDERGLINEISRAPGGRRFVITILDHQAAPGGTWLSHTFTVSHWDQGGLLNRVEAYRDRYEEIDGTMLPRERRMRVFREGGVETRTVRLDGGLATDGGAA